jgi:hypothetical protein
MLAKTPTNLFDFTPYRGLDGVGPFTNDTSVGHPHGWTNEYTVAGGSYFDGSRTNWYTTDYGWDDLRAAITNLRYRTFSSAYLEERVSAYGSGYRDTFAGAVADCVSGFTNESPSEYLNYTAAQVDGYWYAVQAGSVFDRVSHSSIAPVYVLKPEVKGYVQTGVLKSEEFIDTHYADTSGLYSAQGSWPTNITIGPFNAYNAYGWQEAPAAWWSNGIAYMEYGYTNMNTMVQEPIGVGTQKWVGLSWGSTFVLLDFYGGDNPFKYQ